MEENAVKIEKTLSHQNSFLQISYKKPLGYGTSFRYNKINIDEEPRNAIMSTTLIPLLKKFIYILRKATESFRFKSLTNSGINLINDHAYFSSFHKTKKTKKEHSSFNSLVKRIGFILQTVEPIHPYNNLKILWEMIHFSVILILLFLIPIDVCFKIELENRVKIPILAFLIVDLLLNFTTSYFNKGFIVKNRKTIISHYIQTEFLADFISIVFYAIDLQDYGLLAFLKMFFFLRWKKINKINQKLQEKFKIGLKVHPSFIELMNLLVFSFYILNFFACLWFYIAFVYENSDSESVTWLSDNHLKNETKLVQYFYAFYWSTVTIMTVGYGDISATNTTEAIYSSFTIFFGCGLFAYFINSVGTIAQDITKESQNFKTKLAVINKYMERKKIDHILQMKIREYLRFIWEEESTQNVEIEKEIIDKLSKSLRSELIFESYGQILQKFPLFFANFSEKFLSELMYEIKEVRNIPEDSIFTENEKDDSEIYFIVKGKVELYVQNGPSKKTKIQILNEGDSFGEIAFFSGLERKCSAKSSDFTTLFLIKREDFLKNLANNPEDYEKYCMIRDSIIYDDKLNFLQKKCFSCSSKDHISLFCPFIHYVPDKLKIVKRSIRDPGHIFRLPFTRSGTKKLNSLFSSNIIKTSNARFRKRLDIYENDDSRESYEFDPAGDKLTEESRGESLEELNVMEEKQKKKLHIETTNHAVSAKHLENYQIKNTIFNNDEWKVIVEDKSKLSGNFQFKTTEFEEDSKTKRKDESLQINNEVINSFSSLDNEIQKQNINPFVLFQRKSDGNIIKPPIFRKVKPNQLIFDAKNKTNQNDPLNKTNPMLKSKTLEAKTEKNAQGKSQNPNELRTETQKQIKFESSKIMTTMPEFLPGKTSKIESNNDISENNDEFHKLFEKGANFKNYYPNCNLFSIITIQKKEREYKRNVLRKMSSFNRNLKKKNSLSISKFKNNKVFPTQENEITGKNENTERTGTDRPSLFINQESVNKKENWSNNIFAKNSEGKFFTSKKYTFYEVVMEVIQNQELKKKLQASRQKILQMKRKKAVLEL